MSDVPRFPRSKVHLWRRAIGGMFLLAGLGVASQVPGLGNESARSNVGLAAMALLVAGASFFFRDVRF